jgi:hypothetical protein
MPQIELVPRSSLTQMKWWNVLTPSEQRTVLLETQGFVEHRVRCGLSRLEMGKHLQALRDILEPKRIFTKFVKTQCNFSVATAYRFISDYEQISERVPEPVLRTAIARGYDVLDPEIIKKLPPPKTEDRNKIVKYLEKVEIARKEEKANAPDPEYDPELLMREAFNFVIMRFNRLPNDTRGRNKWLKVLIGMLLTELAGGEEHTFPPVPIPEGFRAVLGRPRHAA